MYIYIFYYSAVVYRTIQPNYLPILTDSIDCSKDMQASTSRYLSSSSRTK